jgi:hypothetical protein
VLVDSSQSAVWRLVGTVEPYTPVEVQTVSYFVRVLFIELLLWEMLVSAATATTMFWVEYELVTHGLRLRHVIYILFLAGAGVRGGSLAPPVVALLLEELLGQRKLFVRLGRRYLGYYGRPTVDCLHLLVLSSSHVALLFSLASYV